VHVGDVRLREILVDRLTRPHQQRVGERVGKVDLAGRERQELLERPDVLGEGDLAAGEERLQAGDEGELAPGCARMPASRTISLSELPGSPSRTQSASTLSVLPASWTAMPGEPVFLCLNATAVVTTARFGTELRLTAPPSHFRNYDTVGLAAAARTLPAELHRGGDVAKGRAVLRALMTQQVQGRPPLQVSPQARWVCNGLAAGYARATDARAVGVPVAEEANDGVYRTLLEGLESALARTLPASGQEEDQRRYAIASDGRRYLTSAPFLAESATTATTKDQWWRGMDEGVGRITMPHRPLRGR